MRQALGLLFVVATSLAVAEADAAPSAFAPSGERQVAGKGLARELPTPYSANAEGARPPATAGANPDLAYGAYQRGRYGAAFREATKRIESDPKDAAAMTLLGELYNQGLGVKQDPKLALEWYRLAAAQGAGHAMASLGLMAMDGRGMPKDPAAGRRWLEQAADKREPTGAYNLALLLLGTGRDEDFPRAASLFRVAADAEIGSAQHNLGVLYLKGRGVERDPAKAAQWFRRAADNGDLAGEVEFAILLFNGNGVAKDENRAARYFLHAASRGNAIAQNRVARLFVVGRGVQKNLVEAAAWNLAAAGQGLKDGWLDEALADLPPADRARAEVLANDRAALGQ